MSMLLLVIAQYRRRRSDHDFAGACNAATGLSSPAQEREGSGLLEQQGPYIDALAALQTSTAPR